MHAMHAAPIHRTRSRPLAMLPWIVGVIAVVLTPTSLLPALAVGASAAAAPAPAPAFQPPIAKSAPEPAGSFRAAPMRAEGVWPARAAPGVGRASVVTGGPRPAGGVGASRVPELLPPVDGPLVRGFEEVSGPYGPGHRGVDFGAVPGAPVRAPASGRVTFAGPVAGTTWMTIQVAPAVLVTLGPLRTLESSVGRMAAAGHRLGTLASGHASADGSVAALHLGLRVDGVYIDPLPWIAGLARPRLAPLPEPGGPH